MYKQSRTERSLVHFSFTNRNRIRNATPMSRNVDRLSRIGRIVYPMANACLILDRYAGIKFDTAANSVGTFDPFIKNLTKFQSFFYSRFTPVCIN